jgi:hypothetical protein
MLLLFCLENNTVLKICRRWFPLGLKKNKKINKSYEGQQLLSTNEITQNIIHKKNVDTREEKEEDTPEDQVTKFFK